MFNCTKGPAGRVNYCTFISELQVFDLFDTCDSVSVLFCTPHMDSDRYFNLFISSADYSLAVHRAQLSLGKNFTCL